MLHLELLRWREALATSSGGVLGGPLAIVAVTLLVVGFAWSAAPRADARVRLATQSAALVFTLCSSALLAALLVAYRELTLDFALNGPPPGYFAGDSLHPGIGQERTLTLSMLVLGLAAPGTALAVARATKAAARRALLHGLAAVSVAAAGVCAWLVGDALVLPSRHCLCFVDPVALHLYLASQELDPLVWIPAGAAVLGLGWVLLRRWRSEEALTTSWGQTLVALGVFALGVLAFVATRGHAHDRHHAVSLRDEELPGTAPSAPAWLDRQACQPLEPAPLLEITRSGARLDGREVDESQLREALDAYRRNWPFLHPREPFPNPLNVAAQLDMSWPELEPWLVVARGDSAGGVGFVIAVERPVRSDTLGDIAVRSACAIRLAIAPYCDGYPVSEEGLPANRWATLGETLAEAQSHDVGGVFLRGVTECSFVY